MPVPNETPPICWFCKERAATEKYLRAGSTKLVCAICLDRLEVQDALEDRLLHIIDLERNEQYDDALACLDAIWEANRHRDHDKWLARSIAMHRGSLLFDAGRYAEAEKAYEAWAQLGFQDVWRRWMHAFRTAQILDALGRTREALAFLDDALSYRDRRFIPDASHMLVLLVELSEKLGHPVDPKWGSLAKAVAKRYGIDMPVEDSLEKSILKLAEITRTMQPKFPDEWETDEPEGESIPRPSRS
jgi:tetratricopeptide (TPR) repeat protein